LSSIKKGTCGLIGEEHRNFAPEKIYDLAVFFRR
jgi:hypothetical protein